MDETISDIASPDVTTNSDEMVQKWKKIEGKNNPLRVVFSTYQSIEAVKEFQEKAGVKFDLTICDEAHRTASHEGSLFSLAAEPNYINTVKKLFMTATPKIYSDAVQDKAKDEYATVLYSMDDESKYGPEFFRFGFGEAVDQGVLCDYRVLILAMRKSAPDLEGLEKLVTATGVAKEQLEKLQREINKARSERTRALAKKDMLQFEKHLSTLAGKIQGAYIDLSDLKASNKGEVYEDFEGRVSFREAGDENSAEDLKDKRFAHSAIGFANSIRNSKIITQALSSPDFPGKDPKIESRHIDGKMKSDARLSDLLWLKQGQKNNQIRLITNAQCLSEGVDVPSLDAVVFFEKRQSQIGIIQAVGRVMRQAPGKKYGYIIIPIMLSDNETPEDMLEDSDEYAAIWQVLQSMRSVDERLDAIINTLALSKKAEKGNKSKKKKKGEEVDELHEKPKHPSLFSEDMQKKVVSCILSKCGSSMYWEDWVENISGSVKNMINEIDELADTPDIKPKFEEFKENLSKTLHKEQTKEDAVNLIAQFIVTRPVFSILFPSSDFDSNPISRALESIADDFKDAYFAYDRELGELKFSMEQAAKAVAKDPAARKRLVKNFYEKFYQKVFPKEADANGIVYTPEPVVDFMIKETDRLLEKNFEKRLQDEGIQILDPFSGTGTFVTRLLDKDLGVIDDEHIEEKYEKEIWANEIMPTAYYISTLNIEDAMRQRTEKPVSFPGAVLTDTFCISKDKVTHKQALGSSFSLNNDRENKEEDSKIWAIISNPPYSANQGNANENNRHARYEVVDDRIASTYKTLVNKTNHQANDSYVRAFRWASDRVKGKGIVAFITNGGWLRSNTGEGIRRSFAKEFNDIYVYDLRGNANLNDPKEGGSIFDIKTPVAITFLVKNPESDHKGQIHYISTPDFARKEEKLELLKEVKEKEPEWGEIQMDSFGDWFDQRDASFYSLIPTGLKRGNTKIPGIFSIWSRGVETDNDVWFHSFNKKDLLDNVETFEDFFNEELERWNEWKANGGKGKAEDVAKDIVRQDPTKIKWGYQIYQLLDRASYPIAPDRSYIRTTLWRPFTKKYLYFDKSLVRSPGQQPSFFPEDNSFNLELCVSGTGSHSFSCLMANILPDVQTVFNGQCFPLYRYEKDRFGIEEYERRSAITDQALKMFRDVYGDTLSPDPDKAKEQIFYYVYGLLHSKEYREKYQDTLGKVLPRIPFSSHFKEFEKSGRELAAFHVGYEMAPKYEGLLQEGEPEGEISKMKLDKDKSTLTVNSYLSFKNIPKEAFEYVVNGKSPLAWVVDQYRVKTDKDSQIVSNPNNSSISDIDYVADLIPKLVTVSIKTQEIVDSLPSIDSIASMDSEIEKIWGK